MTTSNFKLVVASLLVLPLLPVVAHADDSDDAVRPADLAAAAKSQTQPAPEQSDEGQPVEEQSSDATNAVTQSGARVQDASYAKFRLAISSKDRARIHRALGSSLGGDARIILAQTDAAPPRVGSTGGPAGAAGPNIPTGPVGTVPPTGPGDAGNPPPGGAGGMPGMPPGAPPLSVILGFADLMLAADRPYEAEKIYKQIQANLPKMDPNDPKVAAMIAAMPPEALATIKSTQEAVEKGLRDVAYAKRPTFTVLSHAYYDDRNVRLYTFGGGPTFRTRYGRVTVTAGTGKYQNDNNVNNPRNPLSLSPDIPSAADNDTLKKNTFNVLLEPYYKKFEGSLFFSNVTYDAAPDRFLYDLQLSYLPKPVRERIYISHGRHDSFFQNVNNQFYAPETYFQLQKKIVYDDYSTGIEYPISKRLDGTFYYRYFKYSDGNTRNNYRTQLMYRIKPGGKKPFPVWRAGLDFIFDDAKFFTLDYTSSFNFNAYQIATDYTFVSRKLKYGFYASLPVYQQNFKAPYGVFGFGDYQLSKSTDVYLKLARLSGPGNSITFSDVVLGTNIRF